MNRFRITGLFVLCLLSGLSGLWAQATTAAPQRMVRSILQAETPWPAEAQEALQAGIEQLPGIEIVRLEPASQRIVVAYQPAENTTDQIVAAVAKLGYALKVLYYPPHEDPAQQPGTPPAKQR